MSNLVGGSEVEEVVVEVMGGGERKKKCSESRTAAKQEPQ